MAEIQMVCREGYCDEFIDEAYGRACHTCWAEEEEPCRQFTHPKRDLGAIPFGDCNHAKFRYIYKGVSAKNYEIEPFEDVFNSHLKCMYVTVGRRTYECVKVILDGKCIFNEMGDDTNG